MKKYVFLFMSLLILIQGSIVAKPSVKIPSLKTAMDTFKDRVNLYMKCIRKECSLEETARIRNMIKKDIGIFLLALTTVAAGGVIVYRYIKKPVYFSSDQDDYKKFNKIMGDIMRAGKSSIQVTLDKSSIDIKKERNQYNVFIKVDDFQSFSNIDSLKMPDLFPELYVILRKLFQTVPHIQRINIFVKGSKDQTLLIDPWPRSKQQPSVQATQEPLQFAEGGGLQSIAKDIMAMRTGSKKDIKIDTYLVNVFKGFSNSLYFRITDKDMLAGLMKLIEELQKQGASVVSISAGTEESQENIYMWEK